MFCSPNLNEHVNTNLSLNARAGCQVHLVGLADLEDWAQHMPVSHHRHGLRQAVHQVAGGLRSQAGRLGGSVKGAAAGALSEAKHLVRDAKDSALVKGVLGFFGRG